MHAVSIRMIYRFDRHDGVDAAVDSQKPYLLLKDVKLIGR